MTDQIYYKIQYPLKKAINIIKKVESDDPIPEEYSQQDLETIKDFIDSWENGGRKSLKDLVEKLRSSI